jgi:hypothetical protein
MSRWFAHAACVPLVLACAAALRAQPLPEPRAAALAAQGRAQAGQRLSDALLSTATTQTPYELGLMWLPRAGLAPQQRQQQSLLAQLPRWAERHGVPAAQAQRLQAQLTAMPVTGRAALAAQDPHWLQGHPNADPLMAEGDAWWLPARPRSVRVWFDSGHRCDLPFAAQTPARDYVAACAAPGSAEALASSAVIVQPDARLQRVGLAAWNETTQAAPAPGAWLWVRSAGSRWPEALHDNVAEWLATQGPVGVLYEAQNTAAAAAPSSHRARSLPLSPSDWGITGLLQTPTARSPPAGHYGMAIAYTEPYTQYNFMLAPFDRVEIGLRYTSIGNRLYGPEIAGDQSYKDKSAEVKLRLLEEGPWRPALALGLRDTGGTGLFAGEYLVASKRWYDVDVSLGLGWGYFGASQRWRNPLAFLGRRYEQRATPNVGSGGTLELGAAFTGRVAPFGGVQWHTPWDGVLVKLEHDGNDYQREPFDQRLPARSPLNAAVVWQFGAGQLSVGVARGGQKAAVSLALYGSLPQQSTPKLGVPKPVELSLAPVLRPAPGPTPGPASGPAPGPALLAELSAQTGWRAHALQRGPSTWTARFDDVGGTYVQDRLGRVWAVLHRDAPPEVQTLAVELAERQLPQVRHEVDRQAWARARLAQSWAPPGDRRAQDAVAATRAMGEPLVATTTATTIDAITLPTPRTRWGVNLGYQQTLGGPDGYLYALVGRANGQLRLWDGAWAQGTVQANLIDNYNRFRYDAPSELPRVRTRVREYVRASGLTVPNLQVNQAAKLGDGVYGLAYAGLLEAMFAGVGGEVLWRPLNSPVAVGVDINRVRQREPEQRAGLLPYRVTTGHVSAYWDTGWQDVVAQVSAGQYLAGDKGVTLDLSRVFANGTRIGVWATKTNVSAEQFGEGSFDKGVYLSIPFDALLTGWSPQTFAIAWQPLLRDGGARLRRGASLWAVTDLRDKRANDVRPPPVAD